MGPTMYQGSGTASTCTIDVTISILCRNHPILSPPITDMDRDAPLLGASRHRYQIYAHGLVRFVLRSSARARIPRARAFRLGGSRLPLTRLDPPRFFAAYIRRAHSRSDAPRADPPLPPQSNAPWGTRLSPNPARRIRSYRSARFRSMGRTGTNGGRRSTPPSALEPRSVPYPGTSLYRVAGHYPSRARRSSPTTLPPPHLLPPHLLPPHLLPPHLLHAPEVQLPQERAHTEGARNG
jgi:hypothetical protein